ncbi:DUF1212-domain-containing protein [Desarmillaria tabescens]|uniref:DUF1212-domain-containing protein n=1 Tax=Armillaria tabescens TaxID=1929756 RepID=A0AA39N6G6_ARMTA|nr:DUF1212-domain-containing protein [Desarmillaria tabescens]KAK0459199.1 DUF1212-domain-containing protein [Desarmillaria tabescens]
MANKDKAMKDNGRGAAGPSGQKTPRKVQWSDNRDKGETHALDEHARDPDAFEHLTHALERHRSESRVEDRPPPVPRIHYFPPRPQNLPPVDTGMTPYQREAAHTRNFSTTTTPSDISPTTAKVNYHDVPGTFIDKDESSGLPGPVDKDYREAANIVRAHTRARGRGRNLFLNLKSRQKSKSRERSTERKDTDAERDAAPKNPRLTGAGGGVLSALLTLYNQPEGLLSGAATPISEHPERPWSSEAARMGSDSSISLASRPSSPKEKEFLLKRAASMSSVTSFSFGSRPKPRPGGGVLGSLIASTGNIAGPAAPTASQIQPDVKRPGYHLSRYSLESKLPTVKQQHHDKDKAGSQRRSIEMLPFRPKSENLEHFSSFSPSFANSPSNETLTTLTETHHHDKTHEKMPSTSSLKNKWSGMLKDFPSPVKNFGRTPAQTPVTTPTTEGEDDYFSAGDRDKEKRRRKRKAREIYITRHVAEIMQRQEFILKLARAMMMFAAPTHRLQSQIQATGRVLDLEVSCMYLPDVMLISFDDSSTGTSSIKFIKQGSGLDLDKLRDAYELYWKVIHDDLAVSDASGQLTNLMRKKQIYPWWQLMLFGGMCSSSISIVSFGGSFIDSVAVFPLGMLLVGIQLLSVRNELYSNVFEITVSMLFSFIAAGMAASQKLCYSAIASGSVVLILPGFIVLCGSLELMSRNLVAGSVRMFYAVIYSLFLGFGLSIGAEAYEKITSHSVVGVTDYKCALSHDPEGPWWQRTPSGYWYFLIVPMFASGLCLRNYMPWNRREMFLAVVIASVGWVSNHFTSTKFVNQGDISAAVGAFAVGFVANLYGRFFSGNAFVIMIAGILFQVPSGFGNGGLLTFVSEQSSGSSTSYLSGFQTALQIISVAIGLTVGLGLALFVVHPIQSRRRGGAVFSL